MRGDPATWLLAGFWLSLAVIAFVYLLARASVQDPFGRIQVVAIAVIAFGFLACSFAFDVTAAGNHTLLTLGATLFFLASILLGLDLFLIAQHRMKSGIRR